jgi:hypothetical protein
MARGVWGGVMKTSKITSPLPRKVLRHSASIMGIVCRNTFWGRGLGRGGEGVEWLVKRKTPPKNSGVGLFTSLGHTVGRQPVYHCYASQPPKTPRADCRRSAQ